MKERLATPSYILIIAANFLQFFGFWLLIPVLPFYLQEVFGADKTSIGAILSCYTIAALCMRPFSGYLLDTFSRKPLYLLAYFLFTAMFGGYMLAGTLTLFILCRIIHGFSFGMVTVSGNTIVIDIMPASRRGEGLGYYGLANNIAMSIGPMTGLFLHEAGVGYTITFCCSLGACLLGLLCAYLVKTPYKSPVKKQPISLDRFILLKGIPAGISLLLLSIPYGMTTNYVAMYAKQIGIVSSSGFFFTLMAIGMAVSRLFSGKLVDKGMAHGIQAVMAQQTVEVGHGGFGTGGFAGGREKGSAVHPVKGLTQRSHGGFPVGVVVKENVRALETGVEHPAEPLDALAHIGRKVRQQKFSETVMGITCGHRDHLGRIC